MSTVGNYSGHLVCRKAINNWGETSREPFGKVRYGAVYCTRMKISLV